MKKILPQANTLATVIKTFVYASNKYKCTLNDVANFCCFETRQASYYCNACCYLGLIDENLEVTSVGREILSSPGELKLQIYELIIRDELIGKIFAKRLLFGKESAVLYSKELISRQYPEYSVAVIDRRARSLVGWCDEIVEYLKLYSIK